MTEEEKALIVSNAIRLGLLDAINHNISIEKAVNSLFGWSKDTLEEILSKAKNHTSFEEKP